MLVNVGAEVVIKYDDVYDETSIVTVRVALDNTNLSESDVAELYFVVCTTEAVIEHVPTETNTTTPDEDSTVHTPVSLLV